MKCPMDLAQNIRLSIRPQCKITEMAHHFFCFFCMKLGSHDVRKVTESDVWKKESGWSGVLKVHHMRLLGSQ